jgi:polyisoprenoid-binding protein YceI
MSAFPAELSGTWVIDNNHSTVGFAVKHAMVSTTRGRFTEFTGGATIDAQTPENSSIWLDVPQHRGQAVR